MDFNDFNRRKHYHKAGSQIKFFAKEFNMSKKLEVKEEVIKEVIESCKRHFKKNGFRKRTIAELREKIEFSSQFF